MAHGARGVHRAEAGDLVLSDERIHETAATGFQLAADVYERARPGYPPDAVDRLVADLALPEDPLVVDLAAGTGKLTKELVARGLRCIAVEPIEGMREQLRAVLPGLSVLDGTAEAMPLDDDAVDAVTVAQAFHWFRFDEAIAEIHRVLRPGARLGLIWNARDESSAWVKRITEIIDPHEGEDIQVHRYRRGHWREPLWASPLFSFVAEAEFRHEQPMTPELLVGRVASTSFIAKLPDDARYAVLDEVRRLAAEHPDLAGRDHFGFPYVTEIYVFEAR